MSHVSAFLSVPLRKPRFQVDWILLVKECIANIGIPLDIFKFLAFQCFFCVWTFFWVLGSLRTSLLCMMEELAGGGSVAGAVAVAVAVSDR